MPSASIIYMLREVVWRWRTEEVRRRRLVMVVGRESFGGGGLTVVGVHIYGGEEGMKRREEREVGVGEFFIIKRGAHIFKNN